MRGFGVSYYSGVERTRPTRLTLCATAHRGIAISTNAEAELAFGKLCGRSGVVRSDGGRMPVGVNALSE